jgi:hypothetical protein
MVLWAVIASTYEESVGSAYPVVRHIFYGKTKDEALGYFNAHLQTDKFLASCTENESFGAIACRTELLVAKYDTVTNQYILL